MDTYMENNTLSVQKIKSSLRQSDSDVEERNKSALLYTKIA